MDEKVKLISVRLKTVSARAVSGDAVAEAARRMRERIDFEMAAIFASG